MIPLYIFDLDGTLALIDHRRHLVSLGPGSVVKVGMEKQEGTLVSKNEHGHWWIKFPEVGEWLHHPGDIHFKPDWDAFFKACVDDKPNMPVIHVLNQLRYANNIQIWSGRSDAVRKETVHWLCDHTGLGMAFFNNKTLRMRKEGDYTPDEVLKKQWLDELSQTERKRLTATFDDRDKVVRMWRDNGVPCFQVAPGDF